MGTRVNVFPADCVKLFTQLQMLTRLANYRADLERLGYGLNSVELKPKEGEDSLDFCNVEANGEIVPARIINVADHGAGYNFSLIFDEVKYDEAIRLGVTVLKALKFTDNIRFRFVINVSTDEEPSPTLEGSFEDDSLLCFCISH